VRLLEKALELRPDIAPAQKLLSRLKKALERGRAK